MALNINNRVQYLGRDFESLKRQLVNYAKNYFPETYFGFSESSPEMMFIEAASYVGDVLSFYIDKSVQETYLQYASNPVSLYSLAYMMGYRPKQSTVSEVYLTLTYRVEEIYKDEQFLPNMENVPVIRKNSTFTTNNSPQISFILAEDVDFSGDNVEIVFDEETEMYELTAVAKAYAGEIVSKNFTFGDYKKFNTVTIKDSNIVGVLDVKGSDNSEWFEVPYLGQSTRSVKRVEDNKVSIVKERIDRRFVTRFTKKDTLELQFGAGVYASGEELLPDWVVNPVQKGSSTDEYDVAYDPSNYMYSSEYGLSPVNVTLTVRYIRGFGESSNVSSNTIVNLGNIVGTDIDTQLLTVTNLEPARGGKRGDTLEDIRQNSIKSFAEQKRAVTESDYVVRALSLPSEFGNVEKVSVKVDRSGGYPEINLYAVSRDSNGKLTRVTKTLQENLKAYLENYKMLSDVVNIHSADIVNVGVSYDIVLKVGYDSWETLTECTEIVRDFFNVKNMNIGEPIDLSELYAELNQVNGVQIVKSLNLFNKSEIDSDEKGIYTYSDCIYDIKSAIDNNVVYPSLDPSIFEIKYPEVDIVGRVVTL